MSLQVFYFEFKAMGSPCHLQFYAASVAHSEQVFDLVTRHIALLENRYSRYLDDSLISVINRRAGTGVKTSLDPQTFALLQYADQCYRESGRLFDITSGVLRKIWNFKQTRVPSKAEIKELLPLIGWQKVQWNYHSVYLPVTGMELDFGGIVKEYAADSAADLCRQQGICSGIIELGGDVCVIGSMPNGRGWPVAIRNPREPEQKLLEFTLQRGGLASSGDYERYQLIDGVRYSHLLNPKTGWPVTGLQAVSVVAGQCIVAGSLATIAMLKAQSGLRWLEKLHIDYLCCQSNGQIFNSLSV